MLCVPLAKPWAWAIGVPHRRRNRRHGDWADQNIRSPAFGEFGVVLMLFVIGLELEPKRLMAMKRDVFGGGALQSCGMRCASDEVPILLWAGAGRPLWWRTLPWRFLHGYRGGHHEQREFPAPPTGQTAFSILLFRDIAAIPLLAIVPLLGVAAAASSEPGWIAAGKAFGAIVATIIIGRYLTRARSCASSLPRVCAEVFTAFALLLVIGIAELMVFSGLSMGLGAFLAGVLLAGSGHRHALETDIEPFKGLLLGLFSLQSAWPSISACSSTRRSGDWTGAGLPCGGEDCRALARGTHHGCERAPAHVVRC